VSYLARQGGNYKPRDVPGAERVEYYDHSQALFDDQSVVRAPAETPKLATVLEHLNIWLKQHKYDEIAKTLQLRELEKSCITGLLKPKVEQASLKYVCKEQRDPASDTPAYVMVPLDIVAVYEGKEYALDNEACKELLPALELAAAQKKRQTLMNELGRAFSEQRITKWATTYKDPTTKKCVTPDQEVRPTARPKSPASNADPRQPSVASTSTAELRTSPRRTTWQGVTGQGQDVQYIGVTHEDAAEASNRARPSMARAPASTTPKRLPKTRSQF
jgi:hypothetical protein